MHLLDIMTLYIYTDNINTNMSNVPFLIEGNMFILFIYMALWNLLIAMMKHIQYIRKACVVDIYGVIPTSHHKGVSMLLVFTADEE